MDNTTAKVSCFARAYHYVNAPVHIFADRAAQGLLGEDYDNIAQSMTQGISFFIPGFQGSEEEGLCLIVDKQLSPSVLGRSAFCERMLENEMLLGCSQYAIFASGYDTYAIRNKGVGTAPDMMSVYELDLPDVIEDKKRRMEKAGFSSNAVYVPCDLSDTSWKENLLISGFRSNEKSFGSLLGISYYLGRDSFRSLINTLSKIMCAGSAICFDYPSDDDSTETQTNRLLAAGAGEQMKAGYPYNEMEKLLEENGFLIYEHLDHEEMTEQYFSEYNFSCPHHRIEAPKGVCYILAVKRA